LSQKQTTTLSDLTASFVTPTACYEKTRRRSQNSVMTVQQPHDPTEQPLLESAVELMQNSPNPFIEMTQVWFRLPELADVVLRIFDAKGKEVNTKTGRYASGENQLVLHRADLCEPGFYTCRLETPFGTASRKLMMY